MEGNLNQDFFKKLDEAYEKGITPFEKPINIIKSKVIQSRENTKTNDNYKYNYHHRINTNKKNKDDKDDELELV